MWSLGCVNLPMWHYSLGSQDARSRNPVSALCCNTIIWNINLSIRTWVIVEGARRADGIFSGEGTIFGVGGEGVDVSDGISRGGERDRDGI